MHSTLHKASIWTTVVMTPLLLSACANMADIPAGASLAQVQAQFGAPDLTCTDRDGNQRAIWSMQPNGQYAWGANIDSAGNTDKVVPVLTNQNFRKLDQGSWNQEQVRCEYGLPAEIGSVGLPSSRQNVWSYRYKENGVWNSLMHVYFDIYTGEVTRYHPGPDPMYDRESFPFF